MRTTLSIDDDVLKAVKDRARQEGRTAGQVLSDLARSALAGPKNVRRATSRNGFPVLPSRGGTVSNTLVDELRDEENV